MYTLKMMSKRLAVHANKLGYAMTASDIELILNTLKWRTDKVSHDIDNFKASNDLSMHWLMPIWYSTCKTEACSYVQLWGVSKALIDRIYIGLGNHVEQLLMELWREEKRVYREARAKERQSQWNDQASV